MTIPHAANPVGAIQNTSTILEVIKSERGATLAEIHAQTDLSRSSIHNYLATLQEVELVLKEDSEYYLSLTFLDYGTIARDRHAVLEGAREEVDELARETREMVNLVVEEYGRGVHLYRSGGENALQYSEYTGYRGYLHNTAAGKSILASLPEDRVKQIVDYHGLEETAENTIADYDDLREELAEVRERGIAFDDEESLNGCRCVGAPITNKAENDVLGAISVSGPKRRMQSKRFKQDLPEAIQDAANVIEVKTSYT